MKFTGVLYGIPNEWVIVLEGDYFRYQELYKTETVDWTQGQMYKIFGKQKFKKIVQTLEEYVGYPRKFEITDKMLTVVGLWRHMETKEIHKSDYDTILWEVKR
ncbi:MAG: hypothetical protein J6R59_01115 [Paludibacteraceae bacterium]|nr:hypothetical protein [Paludibacteraceae bacterium]